MYEALEAAELCPYVGVRHVDPVQHCRVHLHKTNLSAVHWVGALAGEILAYAVLGSVPYTAIRGQWSQRRGGGWGRVTGSESIGKEENPKVLCRTSSLATSSKVEALIPTQ